MQLGLILKIWIKDLHIQLVKYLGSKELAKFDRAGKNASPRHNSFGEIPLMKATLFPASETPRSKSILSKPLKN